MMKSALQSHRYHELLLLEVGENLGGRRTLLGWLVRWWRWLAVKIVRVVEMPLPRLEDEVLGLRVGEIVIFFDFARLALA